MLVVCLIILVLGLVSLAAFAAGCGGDETTETTAAPTETTAAPTETTAAPTETTSAPTETTAGEVTFDGTVTVGALGSLTGAGAMGGAEQVWAYNKAAADINAAGGIDVAGKKMKLELKWVDDKSDATEGAAAVEKLIKVEGTKLILSTQVTPINLAACTVAEKYQAFYQMVVAWRDVVQQQKLKWVSDFFFTPAEVAEVPMNMVELQPEADRPTKWAILTEDNADGQALGEGIKAVMTKHGITPVEYQTYTPGTKDYSSVILKFKQSNVDAIVILISPSDGITFTKQMKEQAFSPKYMMGWKGFWPTQYMEGLGADSNYVCYDAFWSEDLPFTGAKELGEAYKAENKGVDSVSIGLFYANVQILAQAISAAGSTDPAAVRDAVFGHTFKGTVMGDVTFAADGTAPVVPLGNQWMDGKRVIVYPKESATGDMQWFKAWNER
jgi:branched-chain amino acid transport system substrate-binding protein